MAKKQDTEAGSLSYVNGKDCYLENRYYPKGSTIVVEEGSELHERIVKSKPVWLKELAAGAEKASERDIAAAEKAAEAQTLKQRQEADAASRVAAGQASGKAK